MVPQDAQISIRLPETLLKRVGKLVSKLEKDPKLSMIGRITKQSIIRLALQKGLDELEKEYGGK